MNAPVWLGLTRLTTKVAITLGVMVNVGVFARAWAAPLLALIVTPVAADPALPWQLGNAALQPTVVVRPPIHVVVTPLGSARAVRDEKRASRSTSTHW